MKKAEWQELLLRTTAPVKVLCIDEIFEKTAILEVLPHAEIYSTVNMEISEGKDVLINWLDTGSNELPVEPHYFDYILAGEFINTVENKKQFLQKMHLYLKVNGKLLVKLFNARHWKYIEEFLEGKSIYPELRLQSGVFFNDIVQSIENAGYQEMKTSCSYDEMPAGFSERFNSASFDFFEAEPDICYWWIKVCCMDEAAEQLTSFFTAEVRQKLVFLLRRIENDIDVEKNCQEFWKICDQWGVLPGYTVLLANNALGNADKVLLQLAVSADSENHRWQAISLLQDRYEREGTENIILSYVLAGLFYLQHDYRAAEQVILAASSITEEMEELLLQIKKENDRRK